MVGEPKKNIYFARIKQEAQLLLILSKPKEEQLECINAYIQKLNTAREYYISDDRHRKTREMEYLIKKLTQLKRRLI